MVVDIGFVCFVFTGLLLGSWLVFPRGKKSIGMGHCKGIIGLLLDCWMGYNTATACSSITTTQRKYDTAAASGFFFCVFKFRSVFFVFIAHTVRLGSVLSFPSSLLFPYSPFYCWLT